MNDWSPTSYLVKGFLLLGLGLGGFAAWATTQEISGAVVTSGRVQVETRNQTVQHPDGGLIAQIFVREGEVVAKGAPLLRLDGADLQAQRAIYLRPLHETWAGLDRYRAEIRGESHVSYREELRQAARDPEIAAALQDESARFSERRAAFAQTLAQSTARRRESEARIRGYEERISEKRALIASLRDDLDRKLHVQSRGFGVQDPVSALQREISEAMGELSDLSSGIDQARSAIEGAEAEAARFKSEWLDDAQREMRALQPREAEYRAQLRLIDTKIERLMLRAPMAGQVLGLRAHTVGGVIGAGAEVAAIVPADAALVLAVEINPMDVDRVRVGQEASLRFPNFNARITPEIPGRVDKLSADAMVDPNTGRSYYTAELSVDSAGRASMEGQELKAGMPVEAFIRTDARTPASFLLKPVSDYMAYAMREK